MSRKKIATFLYIVAVVSLIIGSVMLSKGYSKMTKYKNSEYSSAVNVNAYVGGDAYNYIINGTYSTTFCTVGMGCMIIALISFIEGCNFMIKAIDEENEIKRNQLPSMD